jgi:hypothetical protein
MQAIQTLMRAVSVRKYAGMIQETPAGIHAMRLDGSTDTVLVVWTDQPDGRRTVEYSKRNLVSATDLMGQSIKSKDRPSDRAQVEIDGAAGPIYFLWTSGSRGVYSPN